MSDKFFNGEMSEYGLAAKYFIMVCSFLKYIFDQ